MSYQSKSPPSIAVFDPKRRHIVAAVYTTLLLQTTLLHTSRISLILLLILWYGMNAGPSCGALFGLIVGACEDALAASGAAWTFADAAAGAFAGALARMFSGSAFPAACAVVPLTLARYFVFLCVLHGERGSLTETHWNAVLCQALLNALFAFFALLGAARYNLPYAGR